MPCDFLAPEALAGPGLVCEVWLVWLGEACDFAPDGVVNAWHPTP